MPTKNRLATASSPYLRLHDENPVDWREWGEEAFAEARRLNKPLFISIGYFSCHWCHEMNRQTFSDPEVAALLNKLFVCIKVDRQERPDVDDYYITYLSMLTGSAGWPATIFASPDGVPFYGGTFFPPRDGLYGGAPGLIGVARKIADFYHANQERIESGKAQVKELFERMERPLQEKRGGHSVVSAVSDIAAQFDRATGGFGGAPKFPREPVLFFLAEWGGAQGIDLVRTSLDAMAGGGVRDQVGGGFFRYATDAHWGIPHFEKMLYTNAALTRLYADMYRVTGDRKYRVVAEETADYVLREMSAPDGGYYAAQNADSGEKEGSFYVWSKEDISDLLGPDEGELMAAFLGIGEKGNFEGDYSHPRRAMTFAALAERFGGEEATLRARVETARKKMYERRKIRVAPEREEVVDTSWSAMMARGFIALYRAGGGQRYMQSAEHTLRTLLSPAEGERLSHLTIAGKATDETFLDDYAEGVAAWIALFEMDQRAESLQRAVSLTNDALRLFEDTAEGGFWFTPKGQDKLLPRRKQFSESATQNTASLMAQNLLRLHALTGDERYRRAAERAISSSGAPNHGPMGAATWYAAHGMATQGLAEYVLVAGEEKENALVLFEVIQKAPLAGSVTLLLGLERSATPEAHRDKEAIGGETTLYLCHNFACDKPGVGVDAITEMIRSATR